MSKQIDISPTEKDFIKDKSKRVLVRKSSEFNGLEKGDEVEGDGLNLLIIDIRDYPSLDELVRLEEEEWIACDGESEKEVMKKLEEKFGSSEGEFLAVEVAVKNN